MQISKETIEKVVKEFQDLTTDYQNNTETMIELASYLRNVAEELLSSNPILARRMINKLDNIMDRRKEGINKSSL